MAYSWEELMALFSDKEETSIPLPGDSLFRTTLDEEEEKKRLEMLEKTKPKIKRPEEIEDPTVLSILSDTFSETWKDIKKGLLYNVKHPTEGLAGVAETGMFTASGMGAFVPSVVAGLGKILYDTWKSGGRSISAEDALAVSGAVSEFLTYKPETPTGQTGAGIVNKAFDFAMTAFKELVKQGVDPTRLGKEQKVIERLKYFTEKGNQMAMEGGGQFTDEDHEEIKRIEMYLQARGFDAAKWNDPETQAMIELGGNSLLLFALGANIVKGRKANRIIKQIEDGTIHMTGKEIRKLFREAKDVPDPILKAVDEFAEQVPDINTVRMALKELSGNEILSKRITEMSVPEGIGIVSKDFTIKLNKAAKEIPKLHAEGGGSTYHLAMGDMRGRDLWSVSPYPELTQRFLGKDVTFKDLKPFLEDPKVAKLMKNPKHALGTWTDKTGVTEIDVVYLTSDGIMAERLARKYNQKAIYNLKTNETIGTGGTGTSKPGFPPLDWRLTELNEPKGKLAIYHFTDLKKPYETIDPHAMGRGKMGAEKAQFKSSGELKEGYLPKSNWYTEDAPSVEAHRWQGKQVYKGEVDWGDIYIPDKANLTPEALDYRANLAGKSGWYDPKTGQVRLLDTIDVERIGVARFPKDKLRMMSGKDFLRHVEVPKDALYEMSEGLEEILQERKARLEQEISGRVPENDPLTIKNTQTLEPGDRVQGIYTIPTEEPLVIVKQKTPTSMPIYAHEWKALTEMKDLHLRQMLRPKRHSRFKELMENPIRILEEYPTIKRLLYDPMKAAENQIAIRIKDLDYRVKKAQKFAGKGASRRIGIHATAQQVGGMEQLKSMGIERVPRLTVEDLQVYEWMRGEYEKIYIRVNEVRELQGLEPMPKVDNYFTFMRNADVLREMGHNIMFEPNIDVLKIHLNAPPFKYARPRTGVKLPVELDGFEVFRRYQTNAITYLEKAPVVTKGRMLISDYPYTEGTVPEAWSFQEHYPRLYNNLTAWLDTVAGMKPEGMLTLEGVLGRAATKLNRNIAMGVLSWNARSAVIQPSAARGAYTLVGEKFFLRGLKRYSTPEGHAFAMKHSNVLESRMFDIHAQEVFAAPIQKAILKGITRVAQKGMRPLQFLDLETAKVSWSAGYERAIAPRSEGGLGLSHKAARVWADDLVIKTQASAQVSDIAPIQRTVGGRLLTLFQTFVINEWNMISKDIMGIRNPRMVTKQAIISSSRLVFATMILNAVYERGLGLYSPYPAPEWAIYRGIKRGDDWKKVMTTVLKETGEQVPVVGGMARWSTPYRTPMPAAAQVGADTVKLVNKLITSMDINKLSAYDVETIGKLLGIPGSTEVRKVISRLKRGATLPEALMGIRIELIEGEEEPPPPKF